MGISLKTHKIIWGRSNNQCAICKNELIVEPPENTDDPSIVGDEAHIIARSEKFSRGDYDALTEEQRDHYSNLILLCKTHHKQIDDQSAHYTVERLRNIKRNHELAVKATRSDVDEKREQDDLLYSSYVDEWERKSDLDNWADLSCLICAGPTLRRSWYDAQKELLRWTVGRIWPHRYVALENAFLNYKNVLQDFLYEFDKHVDWDKEGREVLRTSKFYRMIEYDEQQHHRLLAEYNAHICLANDLFFELTRAANYICDKVRESLFRGYRMKEGVLLVERINVGFDLRNECVRVEYRGEERTELPYPGLKAFKKIRYTTRDYVLEPGDPEPPSFGDEKR